MHHLKSLIFRFDALKTSQKRHHFLIILTTVMAITGFIVHFAEKFQVRWLEQQMVQAMRVGDNPLAENLGNRLAWYRPKDPSLIMRRAEVAGRLKQLNKVTEILGQMPDDTSQSARAALQRGLILRELYRLDPAIESLQKAVLLNPKMVEARRILVGILGVVRRAEEQNQALWDWYHAGTAPVEALRLIAQSVVVIPPGTLAKTFDEGYVLEKCLESEPDSLYVRPPLARFYRNRGEIDKAMNLLKDWLAHDPDDAGARLEWLACLVELGETDEAEKTIIESERLLGNKAEFWLIKGKHRQNTKQWRQALSDLKQAQMLNPHDAETCFQMAQCHRALGELDNAEELITKAQSIRNLAELAAQVDPDQPGIEEMLAVMRHAEGLDRHRESAAWASEILKRDRNHLEAKTLYQKELNRP